MNLQKLQHYTGEYRKYLRRQKNFDRGFAWQAQAHWQKNFDPHAPDFAANYDAALQSPHSKRLWKTDQYFPKDRMLTFATAQPDFVRFMFKDLFDEEKDLEGRAGRFVFHCDQLLKEQQDLRPRAALARHFHDDNFRMLSVYLSFQYPEKYAIYNFADFKTTMQKLGSMDVPAVNDLERFTKLVRTLFIFLNKDEKLAQFHKIRLSDFPGADPQSRLLVWDFLKVIAAGRGIRPFAN